MKVELRIGRLVVHGTGAFDRDAFARALEAEIAARLPATGADAAATARRLRQADAPLGGAERPLGGAPAVGDAAAASLAGRLVGRPSSAKEPGWPG